MSNSSTNSISNQYSPFLYNWLPPKICVWGSTECTDCVCTISCHFNPTDSFTLAEDLMGLDLNPQPHNQQLTSIQELLRNESLVVNKSKWVDSKLQEFGEGEKEKTSSQPSTPGLVKRQNTVELQLQQLGLDANKVSSFTGKRRELSLGARTVLGQLPELSFMLATDRVVQTHQYSI